MRLQVLFGPALLLLCGCFPGVHVDPTISKSTAVAHTTTTVDCGGNKFTISTGTSAGKCTITYADGKAVRGSCEEGENTASVDCTLNAGQGGCGPQTTGSASCRN